MPTAALVLVLVAAGAHAGWNVLAKTASGGATFVWLFSSVAVVLWLPAALVAIAVAPGSLGLEGVGFMAGSGALHALYFVLLQRGYREGDHPLLKVQERARRHDVRELLVIDDEDGGTEPECAARRRHCGGLGDLADHRVDLAHHIAVL